MDLDLEEEYNNSNTHTQVENSSDVEEVSESTKEPVKRNASGFLPHESVEIASPLKERILSKVRKQNNKYWHFQFKNDKDLDHLKQRIESIPNLNLTVVYNFEGQNKADVTLLQGDKEVGKVHFLLCDRRDSNLPAKYYVKLYFFNFNDENIINAVKDVVTSYFNNFGSNQIKERGGKRQKALGVNRTYKKRRNQKNTRKNRN